MMEINDTRKEAGERTMEDAVHIELIKVKDSDGVKITFEMSAPEAGLIGLGMLVNKFAGMMGMQVFDVLSRLTVLMLAPRAGAEEGDGHGSEPV